MKYIIDVQDLWPEAFCMAVRNKFLQKLFYPLKLYVDLAYSSADCVIGVSQTYVDRVLSVNKNIQSGHSIYLGNNKQLFDKGKEKYFIKRDESEIWIGYIGSMGDSYDIGSVIDAINIIQKKQLLSQQIRFILCGDGEKRDKFEKYAKEKNVNASFLGNKPYEEMAGIISSCDIVVNPIVKGSAASIINKVGDYAFSGLPVINTQESVEYRNLVEKYKCGINCRCCSANDIASAIKKLASNRELRLEMGANNRKLGDELFDRLFTYNELADIVESQIEEKKKICIIANFPGSLDGKSNGRFTNLAELLFSRGIDVEVITSTFDHGAKKQGRKIEGGYNSKITLIREPGYSKNISIKRLYSHWIWGYNVIKYIKSLENLPDCFYCAIPSITVNILIASFIKKYKKL